MPSYKDEIFKYITQPENFETAFEIYEIFPEIINQLENKYWDLIKNEIESKLKEQNFQVNLATVGGGLSIKYNNCNKVIIRIEVEGSKVFYGLKRTNENIPKLTSKEKFKSEKLRQMKQTPWFVGWEWCGIDFSKLDTLKKIIPDMAKMNCLEFIDSIIEFSSEVKEDIELIEQDNNNYF